MVSGWNIPGPQKCRIISFDAPGYHRREPDMADEPAHGDGEADGVQGSPEPAVLSSYIRPQLQCEGAEIYHPMKGHQIGVVLVLPPL